MVLGNGSVANGCAGCISVAGILYDGTNTIMLKSTLRTVGPVDVTHAARAWSETIMMKDFMLIERLAVKAEYRDWKRCSVVVC